MVEQLANVSPQVKDKKADYYATVYSTLQERISSLQNNSRHTDREYEKVVESIAKVDKAFNQDATSSPGPSVVSNHSSQSFCPLAFRATCHHPLGTLVLICMLHTLLPIATTADTNVPGEAVVFFLFVVEADILCAIALQEGAQPGDSPE